MPGTQDKTATQVGIEQRRRELDERRVTMLTAEFTHRWGPDQKGDIANFTADLHRLMREVAIEANQPFIEAAAAHLAKCLPRPVQLPGGVGTI